MRFLRRSYYFLAGHLAWVLFGSVSLVLNFTCALLLLLPGRERFGPMAREAIRRLFVAWCAWFQAMRLVYLNWQGFTPEAMSGPAVYIANHPSMMDASFLLSRLPDAICIFKPSFMRNPAIAPAALLAGYASGDAGVDLIRDVAGRVADGRSLLIFPEGTRTQPGIALNPLKPGFALIAARAQAPVRLIIIQPSCPLRPKGSPWWSIPQFPAHVDITLLGELNRTGAANAAELTARATEQFSAALSDWRANAIHPEPVQGLS